MKIFKRMKYIFDEDIEVTRAIALEGTLYLAVIVILFVVLAVFLKTII